MSTVYQFPVHGLTGLALSTELSRIDALVTHKAAAIADRCKSSEIKFVDPCFGPTESDDLGAASLYGIDCKPPSGQYPPPSKLRWQRPLYADGDVDVDDEAEEEEEEEDDDEFDEEFGDDAEDSWCTKGRLFIGGSGSGDIIQGSLGDCWFLGSLSVLATRQALLESVFFNAEKHKSVGLFICKFYKDSTVIYVLIDDRIPVYDATSQPAFARCRDPNELWVPLIEKAYAKIHGCYKALIGGYIHYGLADCTGFAPLQLVIAKGHQGFHEAWDPDILYERLRLYKSWGSLMGCSIQQPPGAAKKSHEAEGNMGLRLMHAYGFIDLNEINTDNGPVRLCRCRNPWGFGEWTGDWGDESDLRIQNDAEISRVFDISESEKTEINKMDGTFFMRFEDWIANFTHIFVAIDFPSTFSSSTMAAEWDPALGGNRTVSTWSANPKFELKLEKPGTVFIGLSIEDSRLTDGVDYWKTPLQSMPMTFDVITEDQITLPATEREFIPHSLDPDETTTKQAPYYYQSTQLQTTLSADSYLVIPSLFKRKFGGKFFITVYSDAPFSLSPPIKLESETAPISSALGLPKGMTLQQFNIHIEDVREKLLTLANKISVSPATIYEEFTKAPNLKINRKLFKEKLMKLGFNLVDFPDEDFLAIDVDNSGEIDANEFRTFFELAVKNSTLPFSPPPPPEDDLQFQPTDLDGEVVIECLEAKGLVPSSAWFDSFKEGHGGARKTLIFNPAPQFYPSSTPASTRCNATPNFDIDPDDPPPPSSPEEEAPSIRRFARFHDTLTTRADTARTNVKNVNEANDKIHTTANLRELESSRSKFLQKLKTEPRMCSSDTQPECWDRLPPGVKVKESYFTSRPHPRKPLSLIRATKNSRNELTPNTLDDFPPSVARNWIEKELSHEIIGLVIHAVFTIREFRKSADDAPPPPNSVDAEIVQEISTSTLVYQRYQPLRILDLDALSGQSTSKIDALDQAEAWFRYIDKDNSGIISFKEFHDMMVDLELMISASDANLLMNRFRTDRNFDDASEDDNMINYNDFLAWWTEGQQIAATSTLTTERAKSIGIPTIGEIVHDVKLAAPSLTTLKSDSASLLVTQAMLRDMGCRLPIPAVFRLARSFDEDHDSFNTHVSTYVQPEDPFKRAGSMDLLVIRQRLQRVLKRRCEDGTSSNGEPNINCSKIWAQLTTSKSDDVDFKTVRDKFATLLAEEEFITKFNGTSFKWVVKNNDGTTSGLKDGGFIQFDDVASKDPAETMSAEQFCLQRFQLSLKTAISFVLDDTLVHSRRSNVIDKFRFEDVDGFVREEQISALESKFFLAMQVHMGKASGLVHHLISLYVTPSKDAILVKAIDPMTLKTHFMKFREDLAFLDLENQAVKKRPTDEELFTFHQHPNEEGAFWRFSMRLNLLTVSKLTSLTSSEQMKFVHHLRDLVQAAKLPFFVRVNELCISFEVDTNFAITKYGGLRKAVFTSIKKDKALHNFLSKTYSSLKVTLSTYDGDISMVLDWSDFLAHLNGFRNPYASLELLPKKVACVRGGKLSKEAEASTSNFKSGLPDIEGGSHPKFKRKDVSSCAFKFKFEPPALTRKPLLFTDVCQMMISEGLVEPEKKLFVLMVRKGDDGSMYATAYDPKSACDYMCEGLPVEWEKGGAFEELGAEKAQAQLEEATRDNKLSLGFGITPRALCKVYNKLGGGGGGDEFLGTCEVSISGVLSNCGQQHQEWAALIREGKLAGHVLLSMQFKRQVDIDMDLEMKKARKARIQQQTAELAIKDKLKAEGARMIASGQVTPRESRGGGQELATMTMSLKNSEKELLVLRSAVEEKEAELTRVLRSSEQENQTNARSLNHTKELEKRLSEAEALSSERLRKLENTNNREMITVEVEKKVEREWASKLTRAEAERASLQLQLETVKLAQEKADEAVPVPPPAPPRVTFEDTQETVVPKFLDGNSALLSIVQALKSRSSKDPTKVFKMLLLASVDSEGRVEEEMVGEVCSDLGLLGLGEFEGVDSDVWEVLCGRLGELMGDAPWKLKNVLDLFAGKRLRSRSSSPVKEALVVKKAPVVEESGNAVAEKIQENEGAEGTEGGELVLPLGWEKKIRDDGKVYYVDHKNRKTQWRHPALKKKEKKAKE